MTTYAGRYSENLQDRYGNGYANATVAVETSIGEAVTLFSDRSKAAYVPASGLAGNEIKADSKGNLQFFADPGNYQIIVAPAGGGTLTPFPVSVPIDPLEPLVSAEELDSEIDALTDALDTKVGESDLVAWQGGLTGEVGRTLSNKLRDLLTIRDFGGVGDGLSSADNNALLAYMAYYRATSAINPTTNGGVNERRSRVALRLLSGAYRITTPLAFDFSGFATMVRGGLVLGEGPYTTTVIFDPPVIDVSGTAQSGSTTSMRLDASDTAAENAYRGYRIQITAGAGVGETNLILTNNTSKDVTFAHPFTSAVDATSQYRIYGAVLVYNTDAMSLRFRGVEFNTTGANLFYYGNRIHASKALQHQHFEDCAWNGAWVKGFELKNTFGNNNDTHQWVRCRMGSPFNEGFLHTLDSDQEKFFTFLSCEYWSAAGPLIKADKGGHFYLYGVDCSGFCNGASGRATPTYLFEFNATTGGGGTLAFLWEGGRVEVFSADGQTRIMKSNWPSGNITFRNVDWSPLVSTTSYGYPLFWFLWASGAVGPAVKWDACKMVGKIEIEYGTSTRGEGGLILDGCGIYDLTTFVPLTPDECVVFTPSAGHAIPESRPTVHYLNCRRFSLSRTNFETYGWSDFVIGWDECRFAPHVGPKRIGLTKAIKSDSTFRSFWLPAGTVITKFIIWAPAGGTVETSAVTYLLRRTGGATLATITNANPSLGFYTETSLAVPYRVVANDPIEIAADTDVGSFNTGMVPMIEYLG